jgi:phosphoglycolate phosphatase
MKSYKMYIFDLDGTLLNTVEEVIKYHLPYIANRLGEKVPPLSRIRKYWGGDLKASLCSIFNDRVDSEEMLKVARECSVKYPISPAKGVKRIIACLNKHHKYTVILSDRTGESIRRSVVNDLNLSVSDFDLIISTADQNIRKPCPELLDNIFRLYDLSSGNKIVATDVVYIGDAYTDLLTAQAKHIDFVAISNSLFNRSLFKKNGVPNDFVFPSVSKAVVPQQSYGVVVWIKNEEGKYLLVQEGRKTNQFYGAWSGPHGRCANEDVVEEETVVREVLEECGLNVVPIRKIIEVPADSKITTVGYWVAEILGHKKELPLHSCSEVSQIQWFSVNEIKSGRIPLYPGVERYIEYVQRYFNHSQNI